MASLMSLLSVAAFVATIYLSFSGWFTREFLMWSCEKSKPRETCSKIIEIRKYNKYNRSVKEEGAE
jgi:hypothetical protein